MTISIVNDLEVVDFFSKILHQILVTWINLYKNLQTNTNFPPKWNLKLLWNPTVTISRAFVSVLKD